MLFVPFFLFDIANSDIAVTSHSGSCFQILSSAKAGAHWWMRVMCAMAKWRASNMALPGPSRPSGPARHGNPRHVAHKTAAGVS
jgi:hypothetical protein